MHRAGSAFVGLDIGTSKVACVIGTFETDAPLPSVIGLGSAPNGGVRKGSVTDPAEVAVAVSAAVDEAERLSGYSVDSVTASIGGIHIRSINSKGVIAVGGINHTITAEDVARVEEAASVIQMPPNRDIIQIFSQQFRLDGQDGIKDPVGMTGVRLEVDAHIVTSATPALKNLQLSLQQAGLSVNRFVLTGLAASRSVLDRRQRETGVVLVDIGAATTSLAVFEEGEVIHTAVLGIGSGHVTNDLAIGLRTDLDTAELVKVRHVKLVTGRHSSGVSVKNAKGELVQLDHAMLRYIAAARAEELFDMVDKELDRIRRSGKLPGGAVLTGGGSKLPGIVELAREQLRLPVELGVPGGFSGLVDAVGDPAYAVAAGLMLEDAYAAHVRPQPKLSRYTGSLWQSAKRLIQQLRP
jgi:cell division protein FtsA